MNSALDLDRFLEAQEGVFDQALTELRRGRKETHWMWFVFPQLAGLGTSQISSRYAIRSAAEAAAYLEHPILGQRLRDCAAAMNALPTGSAADVLGGVDAMKLRSSFTLFAHVADRPSVFTEGLERFFGGAPDPRTIALLTSSPPTE